MTCFNVTQGAALGCILIGLSARLRSQYQLLYDAMITRLLNFQPVFARNIN